ncbi:MAG: Crp/Fnr family transcriptional regulator [Pseudorhodoplanes sp.]
MRSPAPVMDWASIAKAVPLLAHLPEAARGKSHMRSLSAGGTLFRRGSKPAAVYVVLRGEMRLVRTTARGAEIVLQRARAGFLAEASLDQTAYHCDAIASADSEILVIPLAAFRTALADAVFQQAWMAHLARELRNVRAIAERASLRTARERIIHYIETEGRSGTFALTQSKKDWAAELGLTHEALYRELARMQHHGELAMAGRKLRLTGSG